MCDIIVMPNGDQITSIRDDGICLCNSTESEILTWIVRHTRVLVFDETLKINRDVFGYFVSIVKED